MTSCEPDQLGSALDSVARADDHLDHRSRMIRSEQRGVQVVVTSGFAEDASAIEAIRAGAAAYLLKDAQIDELLRTIRGAGAGQVALPAQAAARMVGLVGGLFPAIRAARMPIVAGLQGT